MQLKRKSYFGQCEHLTRYLIIVIVNVFRSDNASGLQFFYSFRVSKLRAKIFTYKVI